VRDDEGSTTMADTAVRVDGNTLRLPGGVGVRFMRTLRLPESGTHDPRPGLGEFPVRRVRDHADAVPAAWPARGGVLPPMYPREAMWLNFGGSAEPAGMRQEMYQDTRPLSHYTEQPAARVFVHLVTPPQWRRITGEEPPPSPVDRAAYTRAGLPWFDYYDEDACDVAPGEVLEGVKPVGDWLGPDPDPWQPPAPGQVRQPGDPPGRPVEDGDW
jgi:hypothetical protein